MAKSIMMAKNSNTNMIECHINRFPRTQNSEWILITSEEHTIVQISTKSDIWIPPNINSGCLIDGPELDFIYKDKRGELVKIGSIDRNILTDKDKKDFKVILMSIHSSIKPYVGNDDYLRQKRSYYNSFFKAYHKSNEESLIIKTKNDLYTDLANKNRRKRNKLLKKYKETNN